MMIWFLLLFCFCCSSVTAQCYQDSDLSLTHDRETVLYQEGTRGRPQCVGNYSVFSETNVDDNPAKGIRCSRKDSTSTDGYWVTQDGAMINCNGATSGLRSRCLRGNGFVTLYTASGSYNDPPINFTCCIEGLCATVAILGYGDFDAFFKGKSDDAQLETCIIVPPSDITAIPQQYLVQMNTSVIPFSRLSSLINCTDGDGITCGQSYYTLIDLNEKRYQMTVPVTWSTDSTNNTDHYYSCRVRFGGLREDDDDDKNGQIPDEAGFIINSKTKHTSISASSAPRSVSYEMLNSTAISVSWSISGDVSGFIINITSDGLDTVTIQLTDGSLREYVINGLLLNRDYTVEVRGYYELLGPANTTTVPPQYDIYYINGSLLSVSDDSSTKIQVNCTSFGLQPDQVTWMINSNTPNSSYEPVNGSVLLDSTYQTYRHYITLTGSFTDGTTISCNANINGESISKDYTLRAPSSPPTGLSAAILSSTNLSISWTPLSDINGYIIQYSGGQPVIVKGEDSYNRVLKGLTQGTTYQINIYSYNDLLSTAYTNISVLFDVPSLTSFDAHPLNPTSVQLTWSLSDSSIIDTYTLSVTRVCDNIQTLNDMILNGGLMNTTISMLSSGFQYTAVVVPVNILGKGIERNDTVTLEETIPPSVAPLLQSPVTINSTAVRLTWDEVNCSYSNGIIIGYRVMYRNEVQQSKIINATDNTTSTVITGLMELQLYYLSVSAINSIGAGPYSEEKKAYTINNFVSTFNGTFSTLHIQLSWQPLPSVTNVSYEYEVAYAVVIDSECTGNNVSLPNEYTVYSPRTSNSTIEVLELMSGTCYVFGVRAYVITSESTSSGEFITIIGSTVSDAIESPSVVNSTFSSVLLSWSTLPVVSIDEYFYEVGYIISDDCTAGPTLPQDYTSYGNTTSGSIEVTGLEDDTCYVFGVRVYSTRTGQHGEWSLQLKRTQKNATAISSTSISSTSITTSSTSSYSSTNVTTTVILMTRLPTGEASSNIGAVGGAVGGVLFLLLLVVLAIILIMILLRRKLTRKSVELFGQSESCVNTAGGATASNEKVKEQDYTEMEIVKQPLDNNLYSTVADPGSNNGVADTSGGEAIYANADGPNGLYENPNQVVAPPPFDPQIPVTRPITVKDFGTYVSESHLSANAAFKEHFKTLYTGDERSSEYGQRDDFKLFNRFKNITVYDDNRVVLKPLTAKTSLHHDFINASYIDGYSMPKKYIASQGPLPRTVNDFWHMIWQEKIQYVVMLTNLIEDKKKKCARYWPEVLNTSETFGQLEVTLEEQEILLHFIIRTLRVELIGSKKSRIIRHYHYVTWPDHGVPESVSPLMSLRKRVMSSWRKDKGPILVHCSAGVGRTGTFIAIDMVLEQADKEKIIDIAGVITRLREQRMKMVQADGQYIFAHDAVLESVMSGGTEITSDMFEVNLRKWRQPNTSGKTPLRVQFELLSLTTPSQADALTMTAQKYPEKNRTPTNLPHEKWKVPLKGHTPDYINASFIDGYREKKSFILAQSPMDNTVEDFLKMIVCYKPSAIVMCCGLTENGQETCTPYWDESEAKLIGDCISEVTGVKQETNYITRNLKIGVTESDKTKINSVNVTQFQFTGWPSNGICNNSVSILSVMDNIGRIQRRSGKGPIIVHCSNSIGRSSVFCAAYNTIEQCKVEGLVDVFQATKAVRMHKPGAVATLGQYDFLHDIVQRYLDQNSNYSNFRT